MGLDAVVQDDDVAGPHPREDGRRHVLGAPARVPVPDRHRPLDDHEPGLRGDARRRARHEAEGRPEERDARRIGDPGVTERAVHGGERRADLAPDQPLVEERRHEVRVAVDADRMSIPHHAGEVVGSAHRFTLRLPRVVDPHAVEDAVAHPPEDPEPVPLAVRRHVAVQPLLTG